MMMRSFAVALVASLFLFVGNASANYTIDLIWTDSGTPTLTVNAGDTVAPAASSGLCAAGALASARGVGQGRCLEIILTATSPVTSAVMTLGWNNGDSGIAAESTGAVAFGKFSASGFPGAAPVTPGSRGTADCVALGCDTAYGSFGGAATAAINPGTYTLGSINLDTSGTIGGAHAILNFLRDGVGGVTNKNFNDAPVQLNGAILNVIPEPGTASLLGLGIMGLVLAGRRRKA